MANVRETHWVPRLRQLVERLILSAATNARGFILLHTPTPLQETCLRILLWELRPFGSSGFTMREQQRVSRNREGKAYIVPHTCSLNRALYLELTKIMETEEFISTLKRSIVRKCCPEKSYLNNGQTFVGAAKWMQNVMQDEQLHKFPCQAEHQVALQPHQSTMVHWAVQENDWPCQASLRQKRWKWNSYLERTARCLAAHESNTELQRACDYAMAIDA